MTSRPMAPPPGKASVLRRALRKLVRPIVEEMMAPTQASLANHDARQSVTNDNVANLLTIFGEHQASLVDLANKVNSIKAVDHAWQSNISSRLLHLERCLGLDGKTVAPSMQQVTEAAFDQRAAEIETRFLSYLEGPYRARLAALQRSGESDVSDAGNGPQLCAEMPMDTSITILNELNRLTNQAGALQAHFEAFRTISDDRARLAWLAERESRLSADRFVPCVEPVLQPAPVDLEEQFAKLRAAAPASFDVWLDRYEAGKAEYRKMAPDSLSTDAHHDAFYFRLFVNLYAKGRVLDIGVGPLAMPTYLADLPTERLAGLDPLPGYEPHPFPFAQSVAEFIPWPDNAFETVIAATSIDHVYLLDRAFHEMGRVLSPGGRLILWAGVFSETAPYDPYGAPVEPIDVFHLFHPGENWFVQAIPDTFRLLERFDVCTIGYRNSFFAFEKG